MKLIWSAVFIVLFAVSASAQDAEKSKGSAEGFEDGYIAGYKEGLKESTIIKPKKPTDSHSYILNGGIDFSKFGPRVSGVSTQTGWAINLNPSLEYFYMDDLAAGGIVEYSYSKDSGKNITRKLGIGPIFSYYYSNSTAMIPYASIFGMFRNQFDFIEVSSSMKWTYKQYAGGLKLGVITMISKQAGIFLEANGEYFMYSVADSKTGKGKTRKSWEIDTMIGMTCFVF